MKRPVREVESRYGDSAVFDFDSLTVTTHTNGETYSERVASRREMWERLRRIRATYGDPSF